MKPEALSGYKLVGGAVRAEAAGFPARRGRPGTFACPRSALSKPVSLLLQMAGQEPTP